MAIIEIPIDDALLAKAIDKWAICLKYEDEILEQNPETGTLELIPNPVSKAQTIKNQIYRSLKEMYVTGIKMESDMVAQATLDAAKVEAEAGIGE